MAADNIGMDNLGDDNEVDQEVGGGADQTDQETSFGGVDEQQSQLLLDSDTAHDRSIAIIGGFGNPGITQLEEYEEEDIMVNYDERMGRAELTERIRANEARHIKGDLLEGAFGFRPMESYGESSRKLVDNMKLYRGKGGKFIGAVFEGKKIFVWDSVNKKPILSRAKTTLSTRNDFEALVVEAKNEYEQNSLGAELGRTVNGPQSDGAGGSTAAADDDAALVTGDVVGEVGGTTVGLLEEEIQNVREDIERQSEELRIPLRELREIRGVLDLGILRQGGMTIEERTNSLGVDIEYWDKRADEETEPAKERFYRSVARVGKLPKDYIRVRNGLKPESDEVIGILKEVVGGSDVLRLERFKRWAKKNMIGISAVAISVACLITGIVMGAWGTLKVGAKGLGRFAGAVARVFKKLGPLFAALGSLLSTALSWGARGILWLASNLWFLAVMVAVSLYGEYGRRKQVGKAS